MRSTLPPAIVLSVLFGAVVVLVAKGDDGRLSEAAESVIGVGSGPVKLLPRCKPADITLPPLYWDPKPGKEKTERNQREALADDMSSVTVNYHYFKHQAGYISKFKTWFEENYGADGEKFERTNELNSLVVTVMLEAETNPRFAKASNLAHQIYNHAHFFSTLGAYENVKDTFPKTGSPLRTAIDANFGNPNQLLFADMHKEVVTHFGSGWVWLVLNRAAPEVQPGVPKLEVISTHDAGTPINAEGTMIPLLVIDVWEHAYYLDAKNDKSRWFGHWHRLVDWRVVEDRFENWENVELTSIADGPNGCIPITRRSKY